MAGTLVANTINTDTGLFSTNNAYSGIAKAWVNFNPNSGTVIVNNTFNVSSVTRSSGGKYTVTFTTAMPNTTFVTQVTSGNGAGYWGYAPNIVSPTTGSISVEISTVTAASNTNPTYYDPQIVNFAIFSS